MMLAIAVNPTSSQINLYTIDLLAVDSSSDPISSLYQQIVNILSMKSESSSDSTRSSTDYKYLGLVLLHMIIILI